MRRHILLGAIRLVSIMFGLDVSIESGIGKIVLAASTDKIPPFLRLPGSPESLDIIGVFIRHY